MKFQEIFNSRIYPAMQRDAQDFVPSQSCEWTDTGEPEFQSQVHRLSSILANAFIAMGPKEIAKYPQLGFAMCELEKLQEIQAKTLDEIKNDLANGEPVKRDLDEAKLAFDILVLANQAIGEIFVNRDMVVLQTAMLFQKFVMGGMSHSEIERIIESRNIAQQTE